MTECIIIIPTWAWVTMLLIITLIVAGVIASIWSYFLINENKHESKKDKDKYDKRKDVF